MQSTLNAFCVSLGIASSEPMENRLRIENRQVKTMLGVVILFILGHFLRVLLNVSELAHEIREYSKENAAEEVTEKKSKENCGSNHPFWVIVIISRMLKANFCITFPLYFNFRCLSPSHTL